jgi:hypothetical protein
MFNENTLMMSTFNPIELGRVELDILDYIANSSSISVYQIYKNLQESSWKKSISYKNIHKRVKRLLDLKLIYEIEGKFRRGSKPYRITTQGLINFLGDRGSESHRFIINNKDNLLIRYLLLEYFEEKTLDSFYLLKYFPGGNIRDYMHDSCSLIVRKCKSIRNFIKKFEIDEILPKDESIQKYLSYLDGKPIDDILLEEIETYENKLKDKMTNFPDKKLLRHYQSNNYSFFKKEIEETEEIVKEPPFPFGLLYVEMSILEAELEDKARLLTFDVIYELGDIINLQEIKSFNELEELLAGGRDYSLRNMLKDKKFLEMVKSIKQNFDSGYKQFIYYDR